MKLRNNKSVPFLGKALPKRPRKTPAKDRPTDDTPANLNNVSLESDIPELEDAPIPELLQFEATHITSSTPMNATVHLLG